MGCRVNPGAVSGGGTDYMIAPGLLRLVSSGTAVLGDGVDFPLPFYLSNYHIGNNPKMVDNDRK